MTNIKKLMDDTYNNIIDIIRLDKKDTEYQCAKYIKKLTNDDIVNIYTFSNITKTSIPASEFMKDKIIERMMKITGNDDLNYDLDSFIDKKGPGDITSKSLDMIFDIANDAIGFLEDVYDCCDFHIGLKNIATKAFKDFKLGVENAREELSSSISNKLDLPDTLH